MGPTLTRPAFVRPALPGDEAILRSLRERAFADLASARGGGPYVEQHAVDLPVLGELADADRRVWLGGLHDAELGYILAAIVRLPSGADIGVVEGIFVEEGARRCGIGELLLSVAADWFGSKGCRRIDAAALPGERATKNFFEEHGLKARLLIVSRTLTAPGAAGD